MSDKSIDFTELADQMKQAQLDSSRRPAILGGEFLDHQLTGFLNAWQEHWNAMPFRILEHIDRIEFTQQLPVNLKYLQRAEIFGENGYLSMRRDARRWLWHYIGQPITLTNVACVDFWEQHSHCQLRRYPESVILWGNRKDNASSWQDDRVAAANLAYPLDTTGRVYLHFWRYTERGQTVFVQYRELRGNP